MADKKISALTGASVPLASTEVLPIVQSGSTVKVSVDNLTAGRVVNTAGTKVTGSAMSSATIGSVLEGSWPWQMWRDTESAQSSFVGYVDGGFWYLKSIPFADRNSAPSGVGTDQFSVRDDGNVKLITGNLVIGTAGKGIDFSATTQPAAGMTSELLADYEEGTWTPAPNSGTFSSAAGQYTRVGRVVTLQFNVTVGTGGGTSMTGNPFTTYGGASAVAFQSAMYTEGQTYPVGATTAQLLLGGGASTINLVGVGTTIGFTSLTLTASAVLIGSLTFIV